ncbi:septum formation initiator family protein [Gordonia sp. NPDC003425]
MAQGSRRSRAADGRRRSSARDPRSSEQARRVPRRERAGQSRSPVSVVETGEQEIYDVDADTDLDTDLDSDSGSLVDPDVDDAEESGTGRSASASRRTLRERRTRTGRRRPVATRVRAIDTRRAVVLALVLSVVALTLAMPLRTYFAQHAEFTQIAASNQQLRQQVADYQQKVNEQNDPAYIEAKARERLQFVKPGETPLVMLYPGDEERKEAAKRAAEHASNPWYGNLWETLSTPVGTK